MPKNFVGVIIEESLEDAGVLKKIKIVKTEIEAVTEKHKTPWIKQWTVHTVEIPEKHIENFAKELSKVMDSKHDWYADFKNDSTHFIIFRNKVFCVDRTSKEQYAAVTKYGVSLGIPYYQLDFSPIVKGWKRR